MQYRPSMRGRWISRAVAWAVGAAALLFSVAGGPAAAMAAQAGGSDGAAAPVAVQAAAGFFPVEQVRPGLEGYGLTVIEGTRIERFDVKVLGLVRNAGPTGDLVLVQVGGPAMERAGGIAAGMSGSPVYVDDRLLGAIGFAFEFSDHSVGLVTPIGDMVKVLDLLPRGRSGAGGGEEPPTPPEAPAPPPATVPGAAPGQGSTAQGTAGARSSGPPPPGHQTDSAPRFERVWLAPDAATAARMAGVARPGTGVFVPVATPLTVSGLGPRALERLKAWLRPYPLTFVPGGGAGAQEGATGGPAPELASPQPPFAPGSALAVSLMRGDIELSAIGTVTYVDGDRFVGFGHPFLQKGTVDFFAAPAYIHRTVHAVNVPFKLGSAMKTEGVLGQDRRAAVAGRAGVLPQAVDLRVEVQDLDTLRRRTLRAQVARDDMLTVPLTAIGALEGLDRALDRIGPGTARVIYRVQGQGLPGSGLFSRDNLYYSRMDVSARLLGEFLDTLQTLMVNPFKDIGLRSVELTVQIEQARRTATLLRARPLSEEVRPGQRVAVEVELQPYRGEREVRILNLDIPKETAPGTVTVTVRGGSAAGFGLSPELESMLTGGAPPSGDTGDETNGEVTGEAPPVTFDKLLEELEKRERNNEIVAEFYPGYQTPAGPAPGEPATSTATETQTRPPKPPAGPNKEKTTEKPREELPRDQSVKTALATPWVIEGSVDFDLNIAEAPAKPSTPGGTPAPTPPEPQGPTAPPAKGTDPKKPPAPGA